jgi:hypothetical protein
VAQPPGETGEAGRHDRAAGFDIRIKFNGYLEDQKKEIKNIEGDTE